MRNLPSNFVLNLQGQVFTVADARDYYGARFNTTPLQNVTRDSDGNVTAV